MAYSARSTALIKTPAALCCVRRMPLPRRNSPRLHKSVILALVEGPLPVGSGRIDVPIARRGDSIIGRCVREDGKPSVTEYTVLAASASHALVSCFPVTGRTHQIRVHFSCSATRWRGIVCTAAIRISLRVTPCIAQCCGSTAPRTMSPAGTEPFAGGFSGRLLRSLSARQRRDSNNVTIRAALR